jgi:acetyltransferase-like isoleucine patch superfamily enzyme
MIKRIISIIKGLYIRRSSDSYIKYLRRKGVSIGDGTYIQSPITAEIDLTRPSLVTIGRNCFINNNFEIYTHDLVSHVFIHLNLEFINSSGRVTIGNNVAFGRHVIVLKGVTIGDNCFIGANSVVSKNISANSIAVGQPAKVVMSIDEYYKKRLNLRADEALDYARSIYERYGRRPTPDDFWEEFPLFVSGDEVDNYPSIPIKQQLGPTFEKYRREHIAKYKCFNEFLSAAGIN